jgi:hypothetical protein
MSTITYKGRTFTSGEEVNISFRDSKFLECVVEVEKNTLYLCHNSSSYSGNPPANKHGKRYAYPLVIKDNKAVNIDDANILVFKKEEEYIRFKLSDRLDLFLQQNYPEYKFLFNIKTDVLDSYEYINEPKKDDKEIKEGYVVLHSKERKKMLKIRLGRLMRKLITNYNAKVGKTINNILPLTDEVIEKLHNKWVAYINDVTHEFAIGKDILKGYNQAYYAKRGNLGSCMTNQFDRLKLYTENPEQIRLMILYYQGEVCGRSLVWKCENGKFYHDRIYTAFDWVRNSMLEIFKKEGITNAYGASLKLKVIVDKMGQYQLPYLDTFRIANHDKKTLSTY